VKENAFRLRDRDISIMVTGARGHIGSYIVEHLCNIAPHNSNWRIIVVDNDYNSGKNNLDISQEIAEDKNIHLYCLDEMIDIRDYYKLYHLFNDYQIDLVFHQASMLTLDSKMHRRDAVNTNIEGFSNILDLSKKFEVGKVVFASSASVYGNPKFVPTSEDHDFSTCKLLYGATKIANEYLAISYAEEEALKVVGLRYFNVCGERQSLSNVYTQIIPRWTRNIVEDIPLTIFGNGSQSMDLIHGEDVGRLNVLAMQNEECYRNSNFEGFLNIGTGKETTVLELLEHMKVCFIRHGYKVLVDNIKVIYEEHDPNLVKKRRADVKLMHEYVGSHSISVDEIIDRAVRKALSEYGLLK